MQLSNAGALAQVTNVKVDQEYAGQRLDNFLMALLKGVPKSRIYRIIRKGEVRVNGARAKPEYKLVGGEDVRIPPIRVAEKNEAPAPATGVLKQIEAAILYEDDRLLVVNKPAGIAVHGGSGVAYGLIEALRALRPEQRFLELVHRLDRDTSGVIMIAKKRSVLRALHEDLRERQMEKIYWAFVVGSWPAKKKRVEAPLAKNELKSGERIVKVDAGGKSSITDFRVVERLDNYTWVEAKPVTGRTHQIRVHTQFAGYPIVGDSKYGIDEVNKALRKEGFKRLCLHAARLRIQLPGDKAPLEFEAPLDEEMQRFVQQHRHNK